MPYTTHGYLTAADLAETRADYDLDLCGCCETDGFEQDPQEEDGRCLHCEHWHG